MPEAVPDYNAIQTAIRSGPDGTEYCQWLIMTYNFMVVLDVVKLTEVMENNLYRIINDALLTSNDEEVVLNFNREAEDEQSAIDSAIEDIQKAGYSIRFIR